MKSMTYDKIIDSIIAYTKASLVFSLVYVIVLVVVGLVILAIATFLPSIQIIYILIIVDILISIPFSVGIFGYVYFVRQARDEYGDDVPCRDFWISFGHVVTPKRAGHEDYEVSQWIDENITGLHRIYSRKHHSGYNYIFISSTDAMAFKLRWIE